MNLTPEQIQAVREAIEAYHLYFMVGFSGMDWMTEKDRLLVESVMETPLSQFEGEPSYIDWAFKFGMLSLHLNEAEAKALSFSQLQKRIDTGNVPLTDYESEALKALKAQGYKDLKGLGNTVADDMHSIVIEGSNELRNVMSQIIDKETTEAIRGRESSQQLKSRLGRKTGDWSRSFGRIAETQLHNAFDLGRAHYLAHKHKEDVQVYKDVYPGACKYCVSLYTTSGVGSKPKVFRLSELIANGNNIGRKASQYKPVIGSTHPFCRCTLQEIDPNYTWNPETGEFDKPKKRSRKVDRKSKIKVTVNDSTYEV